LRSARSVLGAAAVLAVLARAASVPAQPVLSPDPAAAIGRRLDLTRFADERGTPFATRRAAMDGAGRATPWIVSPIYTRCRATCSPLTAVLKRVLGEAGLRPADYAVLSLSFDPDERAEDLAAFRERMALPAGWLTLRATDGAALDGALAALDFRTVALAGGQLDHPNLVAILTPDLRVSEYLLGLDLRAGQLVGALERARAGGAGRRAWKGPLFAACVLGFVASAFVFAWSVLRLRRR
jgi:cytochrome oxidase Cu insertion factor (SCO1/SenC/PrrC family)